MYVSKPLFHHQLLSVKFIKSCPFLMTAILLSKVDVIELFAYRISNGEQVKIFLLSVYYTQTEPVELSVLIAI